MRRAETLLPGEDSGEDLINVCRHLMGGNEENQTVLSAQ